MLSTAEDQAPAGVRLLCPCWEKAEFEGVRAVAGFARESDRYFPEGGLKEANLLIVVSQGEEESCPRA